MLPSVSMLVECIFNKSIPDSIDFGITAVFHPHHKSFSINSFLVLRFFGTWIEWCPQSLCFSSSSLINLSLIILILGAPLCSTFIPIVQVFFNKSIPGTKILWSLDRMVPLVSVLFECIFNKSIPDSIDFRIRRTAVLNVHPHRKSSSINSTLTLTILRLRHHAVLVVRG